MVSMSESCQPQPLQPGGSQPGDPPCLRHLATPGVIVGCQKLQGMLLASNEASHAVKTSYNARNNPTITAYPTQNVTCAGAERPCSEQGCLIRVRGPLEGPGRPSRPPDSSLRSEAGLGI